MKTKTPIPAETKAFFILLIMCCFLSCTEKVAPEKPFIIASKFPTHGYCWYEYYDKNGNVFEFVDLPEKYYVGDIIK